MTQDGGIEVCQGNDQVKVRDNGVKNIWTLIMQNDMPSTTKVIMAIWSFKCTHFPDSSLNKHTARLCAYGGM